MSEFLSNVRTIEPQANGVANDSPTVSSKWPDPDLDIARDGLRPPPSFPYKLFQPAHLALSDESLPLEGLAALINDISSGSGASPDYTAGPLLAMSASLIGNAKWATAHKGTFKQPTVLWFANVGDSGSGKSNAVKSLKQQMLRMENSYDEDFTQKRRAYDTDVEIARLKFETWKGEAKQAHEEKTAVVERPADSYEPDEPQPPRRMIEDITIQKAADILQWQDKGLVMVRDELAGLIGNFGRYGGEDRTFYLEAFEGGVCRVDRKGEKSSTCIEHLSCSLFGTIQPDKLNSDVFMDVNDGLAARVLWLWPAKTPPVMATAPTWQGALDRLFQRLDGLQMVVNADGGFEPDYIPCDARADALLFQFRQEVYEKGQTASGFYASFLGKLPGIALRLSLTLEFINWALSDRASPPVEISVDYMAIAVALLDDYFLKMGERVYGDVALPQTERKAAVLAKEIIRRFGDLKSPEAPYDSFGSVTALEIRRNWRLNGLRTSADVNAALNELVDRDWLMPVEPKSPGPKGGRPKIVYLCNPKLKGLEL